MSLTDEGPLDPSRSGEEFWSLDEDGELAISNLRHFNAVAIRTRTLRPRTDSRAELWRTDQEMFHSVQSDIADSQVGGCCLLTCNT